MIKSNTKNPVIDCVCPMCRVFGRNVKFMDLRDDKVGVSLTIVTCMTCRAVYSIPLEIDDDKKSDENDNSS